MSLKLEDFRKRLTQPTDSEASGATPTSVEPRNEAETEHSPSAQPVVLNFVQSSDSEPMAAAVRKAFGQVGALQSRSEDFTQASDQLDRLSRTVTRIFGPLRNIYSQMSEVAGSFESLRSFQSDLASLSKDFEPMRLLHEQVKQLTGSVQAELGQVVKALDPVKELNEKVSVLSRSLKQLSDLQIDFTHLYAALRDGERPRDFASEHSTESAAAAVH